MRRIRYLKEKIMRTQVIIDADFLNIFYHLKMVKFYLKI